MFKKLQINDFWGKYDKETGEWLSLNDHSADVAACFEALLTKTILRNRLACLLKIKDLDDVLISRFCVFAALHDIGKCCHGFQNKAHHLNIDSIKSNHLNPVLKLPQSPDKSLVKKFVEAIDWTQFYNWFEEGRTDVIRLYETAIGHHGSPVSDNKQVKHALHWQVNGDRDPFQGMAELIKAIRSWFPEAFESIRIPVGITPEGLHAFAGLLMLADWLGSNRSAFPFSTPNNIIRIDYSRNMANTIMRNIGLFAGDYRADINKKNMSYHNIFDVPGLRSCQQTIADLSIPNGPSLVILESETGSGKTEAALSHFFNLFKKGYVDSLYFAVPTRTAAMQLYNRIHKYVERAFSNPPPVTQAVPGYIKSDNINGFLADRFEVIWDEAQEEESKLKHWAAEEPRKYLAGSIVIGTIDQVLLSALCVPYSFMRASALLRHLLVIDEVHASDAYMTRITEKVLNYHLKANGHALLMSATLGSDAKLSFLKAFGGSQNIPLHKIQCGDMVEAVYPLVTLATLSENIVMTYAFKNETQPKKITTHILPICGDPAKIAQLALNAAMEGAKVVILRNTVRDAIETQIYLEDLAISLQKRHFLFSICNAPTLHHSRFCKEDRECLDNELQKFLGGQRQTGGFIVVATQTIQQSLDLDADFMITDLCPMDVLLQRLGRLHRHQRSSQERPEKYINPSVVVMTPIESLGSYIRESGCAKGPHGFGTVYSNVLILEATLQLLNIETSLEIPTFNRSYVEKTIPYKPLNELATILGTEWVKHFEYIFGKKCAECSIASHNVVNREEDYHKCTFSDNVKGISTRLGIHDHLVQFENPLKSPFGNSFNKLTLQGYLVPSSPLEIKPTNIRQGADSVFFNFGDKLFIYDRLGVRESGELISDEE